MASKFKIRIEGYYEKTKIARKNDYIHVDKLVKKDMYMDQDLQKISRCRIFLNYMNISDIVDGKGEKTTTLILNHIKDPEWPVQPYPTKKYWNA